MYEGHWLLPIQGGHVSKTLLLLAERLMVRREQPTIPVCYLVMSATTSERSKLIMRSFSISIP